VPSGHESAALRGRCECNAVAYEVADEFVAAYNCAPWHEILDDLPQHDEYPWPG
jgi:hypothetical protein